MSCFKCFGLGSTEAAATTIGRYYRGNAARGERKRLEAKKHLQSALQKATLFSNKPRTFKVADDETGLLYIKPGKENAPRKLLFTEFKSVQQTGDSIKMGLKTGKEYTFKAESQEKAKNFYFGLSHFVDAKILLTPVVVPKAAAA